MKFLNHYSSEIKLAFYAITIIGLFLITGVMNHSHDHHDHLIGQEEQHKHMNNLVNETSPYLLQHSHNPVNWYPWGEEALAKAKTEDKPIFLSIGYAACHWCHVMERESFENEEIAAILNEHFVSIKVDREERPDLDEIYMTAVVALSGSGGWPMSVFLTPDLEPFFGGTYFPPEDRYGRIGFKNLLHVIQEKWTNGAEREKIGKDAQMIIRFIRDQNSVAVVSSGDEQIDKDLLTDAIHGLENSYDSQWGGFGGAPKFPNANAIALLLRDYHHTDRKKSLAMAVQTLDKMYEGGMYDHLGGGFHRYSTDREWLVPHFEKMLYDNAQLAVVYIEAYLVTGKERYARVAHEIFDYEMSTMTNREGGIFSTEDADSEGMEGIFYLWTYTNVEKALGKADVDLFARFYALKKEGNFSSHEAYHKGLNILHLPESPDAVAEELQMDTGQLVNKISSMQKKLFKIREKRIRPGLDDKIITSWNSLMVTAYARGYQVFQKNAYLKAAERAAQFLNDKMRTKEGKLLRTHRNGKSKFFAYLEDYAYTARAFLDLYEASLNPKWLEVSQELVEEMIAQFWDKQSASFFSTSHLHRNLIVRAKADHDQAVPSPSGVALMTLLRLSKLLNEKDYFELALKALEANLPLIKRSPKAYLSLLACVDFVLYPPKEIAIIGRREAEDTQALLLAVNSQFIPHKIVAFFDPDQSEKNLLIKKIPLLEGRDLLGGKATAYVCENYVCKLPVTSPKELLSQLSE
ncbi:thioredoxin domain-containing protein [Acidobacteriota bacterium]